MKSLNAMLWLATLTTISACGVIGGNDNTDDDTAIDTAGETDTDVDTDEDTDETDIVDVTPEWNEGAFTTDWKDFVDCGTSGKVTFAAETKNWGFDAALYVTQTRFYGAFSAWEEQHTLEEDGTSANNDGEGFSSFSRELTTGATIGNQTADTSTLWKCGDVTPSLDPSASGSFQTTFALAVWGENDDSSTDAPADCIVFGQDPDELLDDAYTGGSGANGADRSLPAWATKANCRIVE